MKMDKQELIEETLHLMEKSLQNKIHGVHTDFDRGVISAIEKAMRLINQLDEPQKVKIPKFVAEYLEYCKTESDIAWAFYPICNDSFYNDRVEQWFDREPNRELFARAWLDGYEVIEELYILPVPYAEKDWYYRKFEGEFVLTMIGEYAYKFTESELDEYFPKIKEFAKRVDE